MQSNWPILRGFDLPRRPTLVPMMAKQRINMRITKLNWLPSVTLGLAILGWTSSSSAVDPIVVNTFDSASELTGWTEEAHVGVLEWANVPDWGGCLKVTLPVASGGTQVQPQVALGAKHFNSAQYWSVSFDLKIDPASGTLPDAT